jgi:ribosome-associated protein
MRSPREAAHKGTPPSGFASFRANPNRLLDVVLDTLDDAKAEDVVCIDIKGKTSIGDQMVVASGRSQRHVGAVADHLIRNLKDVHIFRPEVREFYNLEKMWSADRPMERMVV